MARTHIRKLSFCEPKSFFVSAWAGLLFIAQQRVLFLHVSALEVGEHVISHMNIT